MTPVVQELFGALGLIAAMTVALGIGFRLGQHKREQGTDAISDQVGITQTAVLGLLGLLLAFSFAAAGTRFMERQDQIVLEANAIGTSYLRAELLNGPQRAELRAALKEYTEHRIAVSAQLSQGWDPSVIGDIERKQARIWRAAREGVVRQPEFAVAILTPVNELIDLHTLRLNATRKGLPWLVMSLLIASSLLAIGMIGYGCGIENRRRRILTFSVALLISCVLWLTYDLDHPRSGLLRLSDAALQELKFDSE